MHAGWARWWIYLWGAVAVALVVLAFVLPFKWWAFATAFGFGTIETTGLLRRNDPYPPLTHVIRNYVHRWVAFPAIYGFMGAGGAVWLGFSDPSASVHYSPCSAGSPLTSTWLSMNRRRAMRALRTSAFSRS